MNLMESMKDVRTTSYFRSYAIAEIKIAYRIKEYLEPDDVFPPKDLNRATSILLQNGEYLEAVERIMKNEVCVDIDSSRGWEDLAEEAVDFAKSLMTKSNAKKMNNDFLKTDVRQSSNYYLDYESDL